MKYFILVTQAVIDIFTRPEKKRSVEEEFYYYYNNSIMLPITARAIARETLTNVYKRLYNFSFLFFFQEAVSLHNVDRSRPILIDIPGEPCNLSHNLLN